MSVIVEHDLVRSSNELRSLHQTPPVIVKLHQQPAESQSLSKCKLLLNSACFRYNVDTYPYPLGIYMHFE